MILRRLGNKARVADMIISYFPPHKVFIDVFAGALGMFCNKPKAQYNILNDLDGDVYNLFNVVRTRKDELEKAFYEMPYHKDLFDHWKEHKETEPLQQALRFIFLSNFTFMGKGNTLKYGAENAKKLFLDNLQKTYDMIWDVQFNNCDFRDLFKMIEGRAYKDCLIYLDPPYLDTTDNYSNSFTKEDSVDLFDAVMKTGSKFAMSEFAHPFILEQAKERKLTVTNIGARQNLASRAIEILITNYVPQGRLF